MIACILTSKLTKIEDITALTAYAESRGDEVVVINTTGEMVIDLVLYVTKINPQTVYVVTEIHTGMVWSELIALVVLLSEIGVTVIRLDGTVVDDSYLMRMLEREIRNQIDDGVI